VERLDSTSTVMGLFERWDCSIEERQLHPGDTLVVYTDGASQASNPAGEEFGEERLLEAVKQNRELDSQELLAALLGQLRQFSPYEQADDITLIVAKCT
jgi:sigma-B regulation protein RsbU (phosphoserine phosphatase)